MLHSRSSIHRIIAGTVAVLMAFSLSTAAAQQQSGEPLLEVPIYKVPEGMTLQDYEDANRRITMGLFYAITPGGMHFYANEDTTGWILLGSAVGGLVGIIVGSSTARDVPQANDDYRTTVIDGNTFYKIPVEDRDGSANTTYRLKEVSTTRKGLTDAGGALAGIGVTAILSAYIWDIFHGIRVIEKKRSIARYKFGRLNNQTTRHRPEPAPRPIVEMKPMVDPQQGAGGVQVEMRF